MKVKPQFVSLLAATALAFTTLASAHGPTPGERVTENFSRPIPNIPGKSLVALEVVYAPGASSPAHSHAKSAFIYGYVVSGEIESKVGNDPAHVYKAGESFYENPGARHPISRNASKTEPAKLLAVFVVDTDATELTTPDK